MQHYKIIFSKSLQPISISISIKNLMKKKESPWKNFLLFHHKWIKKFTNYKIKIKKVFYLTRTNFLKNLNNKSQTFKRWIVTIKSWHGLKNWESLKLLLYLWLQKIGKKYKKKVKQEMILKVCAAFACKTLRLTLK